MSNTKWKFTVLVAVVCTAGMVATQSSAQTPIRTAERARQAQSVDSRFTTIQRLGLNDPTLRLTTEQRAQIDAAIMAYIGTQGALAKQLSANADARSREQAIAARRKGQDELATAIGSLMSAEQRQTWEGARAAREAQINARTSRNRSPVGN